MHKSDNYIWLSKDAIGHGATGDVFKGIDKKSGHEVAIKVPRMSSREGFNDLQQRELDVLRKFKHRNIVKLIAVEQQPHGGPAVIVMEFCNGGSLFNMLHQPQNVFGFEDDEFFIVLQDLAAGMHKLQSENVIHRDIKPGNIMRCIGLDGRTVYKLIDFDAARELLAEEEFESIYGTEEYLHPQMYNRCFMKQSTNTAFPHSVDLWSIAVTLYHVAAGQLPFQSFHGRKDRETMWRIISGRGVKDISGVQEKMGGTIKYDQHLPRNIAMSEGLRPNIEELLVMLFDQQTTFQDFFTKAQAMSQLRRICTFHYASTELQHHYLSPTTTYHNFQHSIHKATNIPPNQQLLIFQNLHFSSQFSSHSGYLLLKKTLTSDPVYLFSHQRHMPTQTGLDNRTFNFPDVKSHPKFNDLLWKSCLESLHYILRTVVSVVQRQAAISGACKTFMQLIMKKFDLLENFKRHVSDLLQCNISKLNCIKSFLVFVTVHQPSHVHMCALDTFKQHLTLTDNIKKQLLYIEEDLERISDELQVLVGEWLCEKPSCRSEDCCEGQMRAWIKEVSEMKKNTQEAHIHKEKLSRALKTAKMLVEGHCQVNSRSLYTHFLKFMTSWWNILEDLKKHERQLSSDMASLKIIEQQQQQDHDDRNRNLNIQIELQDMLKDFNNITNHPNNITPTNNTESVSERDTETQSVLERDTETQSVLERDTETQSVLERETREGNLLRQLMSIVGDKKCNLLKEMLPLAEENNKLIVNIHQSFNNSLKHTNLIKE